MKNITYEEFIQNILNTRGRFACGEEYHERHHIVPRCMGGTNNENNLIDLYAKEHFEAHRLLAVENPCNSNLVYAWNMMRNSKNKDYEITAEEYEEVKKVLSSAASGDGNPFYGKKHSQETREIMSKNHANIFGENNPFYGKHHTIETIEIIKAKNIGRKDSLEANKKKAHWGTDNPSSKACIAVFDDGYTKEYDMIKLLVEDLGCQNASAYARGILGSPSHYWKAGHCYIYYRNKYLENLDNR